MKEQSRIDHKIAERAAALEKQKKSLAQAEEPAAIQRQADQFTAQEQEKYSETLEETMAIMDDSELNDLIKKLLKNYGFRMVETGYKSKGFLRGKEKTETVIAAEIQRQDPIVNVNFAQKRSFFQNGKIAFDTVEGRVTFYFYKQEVEVNLTDRYGFYQGFLDVAQLKELLIESIAMLKVHGFDTKVGEVMKLEYTYGSSDTF